MSSTSSFEASPSSPSGAGGFAHRLKSVASEEAFYMDTLHQSRSNFADDLGMVRASLCSLLKNVVDPEKTNDAADGADSAGLGGSHGDMPALMDEAELVGRHVEMLSKELYYFASRFPSLLPWSPSSALQLMWDLDGYVLQPTKSFAGPQLPCFRIHDELATAAEIPARRYTQSEMWEYRQSTMREFLTPQRIALAGKVVEHFVTNPGSSNLFAADAARAKRSSPTGLWVDEALSFDGFYQLLEDPRTFVHFGDGLVLHLWRFASEARRMVSCGQKVWQSIFEHGLHPYGTLITAVVFVKGIAVTFTQLPPLLPCATCLNVHSDPEASAAAAVGKALGVLVGSSTSLRSSTTTPGPTLPSETTAAMSLSHIAEPRLCVGADGRYYFMNPCAFGITIDDLQSASTQHHHQQQQQQHAHVWQPRAAPLRLEWYHHILHHGTSFPYTYDDVVERVKTGPVVAALEFLMKSVPPAMKLPDVVMQQVVSNTLHGIGLNIRFLFLLHTAVLDRKSKVTPGSGEATTLTLISDALLIEMVCRSVKTLLRAEAATFLGKTPDLADAAVESKDVTAERVNRFMEWLACGPPALWDAQIMPVLRRKFISCPDSFHIPFHPKYFKILLWYLTPKFGVAFDAKQNRFSRSAHAEKPNSSFFVVPDVVKMTMNKQHEEAFARVSMWWSAAEALPTSTPMAWMERTLRLQRVALIMIILRHAGRLRMIDTCIKCITSASPSTSYAMHRAMVALFQLSMMDQMPPSRLEQSPLFQLLFSVASTWLPAKAADVWTAEHTKDRFAFPGASLGTCHFLGFALRSIYDGCDSDTSANEAASTQRMRSRLEMAVALHSHCNARVLSEQGSSPSGTLSAPLALDSPSLPVDVACNAMLLAHMSHPSLSKRPHCVAVAGLARYAVHGRCATMNLATMNPVPTIIQAFHSAVKRVWDDSQDRTADWEGKEALGLGTAWSIARVAGLESSETTSDGVGLVSDFKHSLDTASEASVMTALYNKPQTIFASLRCFCMGIRRVLGGDPSLATKSQAIGRALRVLFDIESFIYSIYPNPSSDSAADTSGGASQSHPDNAFTLDILKSVRDLIASEPFANACAVLISEVLTPHHQWRLAVMMCEFFSYNDTVAKIASTKAVIQQLEDAASRASLIQSLFRKIHKGGAALVHRVGSKEWHRVMSRRMQRIERESEWYACGMDVYAESQFMRLARMELSERERATYWTLALAEEVAFNDLLSGFSDGQRTQLLQALEMEASRQWVATLSEAISDMWCAFVESDFVVQQLQLQDAYNALCGGVQLLTLTASESHQREEIVWGECVAWLDDVVCNCEKTVMWLVATNAMEAIAEDFQMELQSEMLAALLESLLVKEAECRWETDASYWMETASETVFGAWLQLDVLAVVEQLAVGREAAAVAMEGAEETERASNEWLWLQELAVESVELYYDEVLRPLLLEASARWYFDATLGDLVPTLFQQLAVECELASEAVWRQQLSTVAVETLVESETRDRTDVTILYWTESAEVVSCCESSARAALESEELSERDNGAAHQQLTQLVVVPELEARTQMENANAVNTAEMWQSLSWATMHAVMPNAWIEMEALHRSELWDYENVMGTQIVRFAFVCELHEWRLAEYRRMWVEMAAQCAAAFGSLLLVERSAACMHDVEVLHEAARHGVTTQEAEARDDMWRAFGAHYFDSAVRSISSIEASIRIRAEGMEWTTAYAVLLLTAHSLIGDEALFQMATSDAVYTDAIADLERLQRQHITARAAEDLAATLVLCHRQWTHLALHRFATLHVVWRKASATRVKEASLRTAVVDEEADAFVKIVRLHELTFRILQGDFFVDHRTLVRPSQRAFQMQLHKHQKHQKEYRERVSPQRDPSCQPPLSTADIMSSPAAHLRVDREVVPSRFGEWDDDAHTHVIRDIAHYRYDVLCSLEVTSRQLIVALEGQGFSNIAIGWTRGDDAESVRRALQTPSWDKAQLTPTTSVSTSMALSDAQPAPTTTFLTAVDTPVPHQQASPLRRAAGLENPVEAAVAKRLRGIVADEVVRREILVQWERNFWSAAKSDMQSVHHLMNTEVALLGAVNRNGVGGGGWLRLLPAAGAWYPTEIPPGSDSKAINLWTHLRRFAGDQRACIAEAASAVEATRREEARAFRRLLESERSAVDMLVLGIQKRQKQKVRDGDHPERLRAVVGIKGKLPLPIPGPLPLPQVHVADLDRSPSKTLMVLNPTLAASEVVAARRSLPSLHSLSAAPESIDVLLREWTAKRVSLLQPGPSAAVASLDDITPSEIRLRMRLEELEQMDVLEVLNRVVFAPNAALSVLAATLSKWQPSLTRGSSSLRSSLGPASVSSLLSGGGATSSPDGMHQERGAPPVLPPLQLKSPPSLGPLDPQGRKRVAP